MNQLLRLPFFALALTFVGCFTAAIEPDPCLETRRCVPADDVGCCAGAGRDVTICQTTCPAGMIEEAECRTAGCGTGCDDPIACRIDIGGGCCGESVYTTSCDTCPAGSVNATTCTADYPNECGCGGVRLFRAPGEADRAAIAPPAECYEDLGGGCCGDFVTADSTCGCPPGTITQFECSMNAADPIAPPVACREDLGGGCCGATVAANACTAACPAGSIAETSCGDILDAPAEPGAPARIPPAPCFELMDDGCCGAPVDPTACGVCPAGATDVCELCPGEPQPEPQP